MDSMLKKGVTLALVGLLGVACAVLTGTAILLSVRAFYGLSIWFEDVVNAAKLSAFFGGPIGAIAAIITVLLCGDKRLSLLVAVGLMGATIGGSAVVPLVYVLDMQEATLVAAVWGACIGYVAALLAAHRLKLICNPVGRQRKGAQDQ